MDDFLYDIDQLTDRVFELTTRRWPVFLMLPFAESNANKVEIVYNLLKRCKFFPVKIELEKSAAKSILFRNIGNDYFKKRNDDSALKYYNLAVLHAPNLSRELSLAFANRSAITGICKNYKECLNDIENALAIDYDESIKPKLLKRKAMCEKAIAVSDVSDELETRCKRQFRLSKEPNPAIPCATNNIKITYSKRMGRGVVATDDIKPGEVIVTEQPYCNVLLVKLYVSNCYKCFKKCDSMLPCEHCCVVMFCSVECRTLAWERFHRIECPLMPLLVKMNFTEFELLAFRTVVQAKCTLSWENLIKTINEAESEVNPLIKGFSKRYDSEGNETLLFDSLSYTPIHTIATDFVKPLATDTRLSRQCVTAAVFLHFLIEYTDFFSEYVTITKNECIKLIRGLLLQHGMTSPSSRHSIDTHIDICYPRVSRSLSLGRGAYAFLSLFNHSCAPSVLRCCSGTTITLIALKPIKKGEEVYDNYGCHFTHHSRIQRHMHLLLLYNFQCTCEACVNNWPPFDYLPIVPMTREVMMNFIVGDALTVDALRSGDRRFALSLVNQLYLYVSKYNEYAPNVQLIYYQETIKECWILFGNIISLK